METRKVEFTIIIWSSLIMSTIWSSTHYHNIWSIAWIIMAIIFSIIRFNLDK